MDTQDKTLTVKHKKNGIVRVFSETQNRLMGKQNRKMFKQDDPSEAGDLETKTQETEAQRLDKENADLRKQLAEALAGKSLAPVVEPEGKSEDQLRAEGLRAENSQLQADLSSAIGSTEEALDDQADPNPELTAIRTKYEQVTGKKPGRSSIDTMNEAIAKAEQTNKDALK